MKRRSIFTYLAAGFASMVATCREIYAKTSRWGWPGYPSKSSLRDHLKNSKNHPYISNEEVDNMTFEQMISYHDADHKRRGDSPKYSKPKHVPGTK